MSPIIVRATDLIGDAVSLQRAADGRLFFTISDDVAQYPEEIPEGFSEEIWEAWRSGFVVFQFPKEIQKLWGLVLLMAERDRATSVHYHPWRSDGRLIYIVEGLRYELVPPPDEHAAAIIETARSVFTAPPAVGLLSRFVGRAPERAVCSTFSFEAWDRAVLWDVVCWSNGERAGVELFRVTPLEEVPPAGGIVPTDPHSAQ
ncbi:hypothetical protein [Frigoriglobus tundricola]|uniref:Uncharacterized protein n=1 Tax=Frigoriglobus tundricola TaxID=2774151 RepID=A0A6M5YP28_9BACT|nr:hypothetical protein [Frigoriglobus tundricola]QJW95130.1 hypothetical protein FTUN_2669 [Frigoriglobus tundricola]